MCCIFLRKALTKKMECGILNSGVVPSAQRLKQCRKKKYNVNKYRRHCTKAWTSVGSIVYMENIGIQEEMEMAKTKKIVIGTVAGVTAAAVCVTGGIILWRHMAGSSDADGIAYVTAVSDLNTAAVMNADLQFSGVVEPQETTEVKIDLSKTVSEIMVAEGDHVDPGDPLFSYDIEAMELEYAQGGVEIERMENEIASSKQQIAQLEKERKDASADDKLSYTTQIQSLETDIAKTEYDIKTKKLELEKLQNTIDHATVTAEISGTVQSLKTVEQLTSEGGDVLMKITSDGEFRIKCTVSEQNMYMLYQDEAVQVHSRVNDDSWTGVISEIGTEPETNQNEEYYMESGSSERASKYSFYITLDASEGLMLGQHLLVSPDMGSETIEKSGIWLYSDYVLTDDNGKSYVWAATGRDRLEKREVELGQTDEMMGDCEIVSGLTEEDLIAYPSDSYKEGMRTTTNIEDIPVDENEGDMGDMGDMGDIADGAEDGVAFDEDGNPIADGELDVEGEIVPEEKVEDGLEGGAADGN